MKKRLMKLTGLLLVFTMVFTTANLTYAAENETSTEEAAAEDYDTELAEAETEDEDNEEVVIDEDDKPFLALGEDLTKEQRSTVLKLMGIKAKDLEKYNVVYVTNEEEHKYLGEYIDSSAIGTHALSSVVITQAEKGSGLHFSAYNVNYCTVGMYKNACATAGIKDANVIVAAPFTISGTAALIGILKAYEEMTGEKIDEDVVDGAMDELVTTGELNESIDGDSDDVEAFIADLKEQMESANWESDEDILTAIETTADKYNLNLSKADKEKVLALLKKLKDLDLDWDSIADSAEKWADKIADMDIDTEGIFDSIAKFFKMLADLIGSIFK